MLDRSTPFPIGRWIFTVVLIIAFMARVLIAQVCLLSHLSFVLSLFVWRVGISSRTPWPSTTSTSCWPFLPPRSTRPWQSMTGRRRRTAWLCLPRRTRSSDHSSGGYRSSSSGIPPPRPLPSPFSARFSSYSTSQCSGPSSSCTSLPCSASQWRDKLR